MRWRRNAIAFAPPRCCRAATLRNHSRHASVEIAALAVQRLASKEIAKQLHLSVRTVDNHLQRIYTKLGIGGRSELAGALDYVEGA